MRTIGEVRKSIESDGCVEVVHRVLDDIEKSPLNDFITVAREQALSVAEQIERNWKEWCDKPLAGIPIAIKDNISTRGIETTCASRILRGYVPPFDATVVERLKNAGAIIVGKTNMDEFGMGTTCEYSFIGPTKNPHDLTRVAGGSSGGSAATVASGEVPVSLGSDTGGSIRCPASFCGCIGLKPTYGAVSRYGLVAYANSLEQIGPLSNTISDLALVFDVIAGWDRRDSTTVNVQMNLKERIESVEGRRIALGIPKELSIPDERVQKVLWSVIHSFEESGVDYREVSLPHIEYSLPSYYIIAMSEASSNLARFDGMRYGLRTEDTVWYETFSNVRGMGFGEEVKRRIVLGTFALSKGYQDRYYLKALKVRRVVKMEFERVLNEVDAIITPTMPCQAFRIGEIKDPLTMYLADVFTVP
ncbi:Asp-tRNA(Asn)/Glu-tRNA(Gln) amidotransferase GatCAB subunit A, partial [Methanosarcinales archaeon]